MGSCTWPLNKTLKQTVGTTVFLTARRIYSDLCSRPLLSFSLSRPVPKFGPAGIDERTAPLEIRLKF